MANRPAKEELPLTLPQPAVLAAWLACGAAFVWFHWSSLMLLLNTWMRQEDYVYGFAVPPFAVFLLWYRRDMLASVASWRGSWWGLAVLGVWAFVRWWAVYFNYGSFPELAILVFLAGMAIFIGGWHALHWSWPSIFFLIFMIPLPGRLQSAFSFQLQGLAAKLSAYVIQTLGIPAMAVGHVISLGESAQPIDVAAACSGLKMMMLFFAMCVGIAFVVKKPLWEKLLIAVSAIPIAIASNIMRIVTTAILFEVGRRWPSLIDMEKAHETVHNWVGILVMMPTGLVLLWAEIELLSKLLLEPVNERPLIIGGMARGAIDSGDRQASRRGTPQ